MFSTLFREFLIKFCLHQIGFHCSYNQFKRYSPTNPSSPRLCRYQQCLEVGMQPGLVDSCKRKEQGSRINKLIPTLDREVLNYFFLGKFW